MASLEGSKADMCHIDKEVHHKGLAGRSMGSVPRNMALAPHSVVLALHNMEEALRNMEMAPRKDLHTLLVEDRALHSVPLEDCIRGSLFPPGKEVCLWGGSVSSLGTRVLHKDRRTPRLAVHPDDHHNDHTASCHGALCD